MNLRSLLLACAALFAAHPVALGSETPYRNLSTGGPLRPGIYGRIEWRHGVPPPVVHAAPVQVERGMPAAEPVYLYVPPGQLRRWAQHCAKWQACDRPVYFVRVDDSPSRLGAWKKSQRPVADTSLVGHAFNRFAQP